MRKNNYLKTTTTKFNRNEYAKKYRQEHKKKHYCFFCGKLLNGCGRTKYCDEHRTYKKPKRPCEYCNINPIAYHAKRYCSEECRINAIKERKILNKKRRFCIKCNKDITDTEKIKYCPECSIIAEKENTKRYTHEHKFKYRKNKYCIICGKSLINTPHRQKFCYDCVPNNIKGPYMPTYIRKKFPEKFVYIPSKCGYGSTAVFADGMSAEIQKQVPKMIEDTIKKLLNEEETNKRCDKMDKEGWCTMFGGYPKSKLLCKYWPEECPLLNNKTFDTQNKPCPKCGKIIHYSCKMCRECASKNRFGLSRYESL